MKLRIRDNSLRLRLMQGEVRQLRDTGVVVARTMFPDGREFSYALEASPASVRPGAAFDGGTLTVRLPEAMANTWADTDEVGIRGEVELEDSGTLVILVEKDFTCLAPREGEDESDMYPHPLADETDGG
jgi:hypothetical protein